MKLNGENNYKNQEDDLPIEGHNPLQNATEDTVPGGIYEIKEKPTNIKEAFLNKIQSVNKIVQSMFRIANNEQLTKLTDDALVHIAEDENGLEKNWNLTKVSGRLGSNEGGWYESPDGRRYYVKFYKNPSQAKVEFIANAIYNKLGIKAAHSELIRLDDREAIASLAVPNATYADMETQKNSRDVQEGFVADAFLANWDVVGLDYDNIVEGKDGLYRIDNGGSMIFRAQGKNKDYSPNSIPELQTMLEPGRSAGDVFSGIAEDDIRKQAQDLVKKLSSEDIYAIVEESGLEGEEKDRVLNGLLGRCKWLAKMYCEPQKEQSEHKPRRSLREAISDINNAELENSSEAIARLRAEIICDRDHISNQRIDIIKYEDGKIELSFKVRNAERIVDSLVKKMDSARRNGYTEALTDGGARITTGSIEYKSSSPESSYRFTLCDAFVLERDGIKVYIADPTKRDGLANMIDQGEGDEHIVRTAIDLIKIELPANVNVDSIEEVVNRILDEEIGISDALSEVSPESEESYKIARYAWQHKIDALTMEQARKAEEMEREEVFSDYTTFVERGVYQEYLARYGDDLRAYHSIYESSAKSIYKILTQGLMSTTERFSRGVTIGGESSINDIDSGGADGVFTRISKPHQRYYNLSPGEANIVFKPNLFDRTDWYSYPGDRYGTTQKIIFDSKRLSPSEIMLEISEGRAPENEQIFRTGIGPNYIDRIEMFDNKERDSMIKELKDMGLDRVGDRLIEEIIISIPSQEEIREMKKQAKEKTKQTEQDKYLKKLKAITSGNEEYSAKVKLIELAMLSGGNIAENFLDAINFIAAKEGRESMILKVNDYLMGTYKYNVKKLINLLAKPPLDPTDPDYNMQRVALYINNELGIDIERTFAQKEEKYQEKWNKIMASTISAD